MHKSALKKSENKGGQSPRTVSRFSGKMEDAPKNASPSETKVPTSSRSVSSGFVWLTKACER